MSIAIPSTHITSVAPKAAKKGFENLNITEKIELINNYLQDDKLKERFAKYKALSGRSSIELSEEGREGYNNKLLALLGADHIIDLSRRTESRGLGSTYVTKSDWNSNNQYIRDMSSKKDHQQNLPNGRSEIAYLGKDVLQLDVLLRKSIRQHQIQKVKNSLLSVFNMKK